MRDYRQSQLRMVFKAYIYNMTALLGLYTEVGFSDPPPRRSAEDYDN